MLSQSIKSIQKNKIHFSIQTMLKNVFENLKNNNKDTFKKTIAVGIDFRSKICYTFMKLF